MQRKTLQVEQDERFFRRNWIIQRIGWIAMALIIVAGLLGLFGAPGPLSRARASRGPIEVEFDRLVRMNAPSEIHIDVGSSGPRFAVSLNRDFVDAVEIRSITPSPKSVEIRNDRVLYTFEAGRSPRVTYSIEYLKMGAREGRIGLEGGPSLTIRPTVYP